MSLTSEREMFGCTIDELQTSVEESITFRSRGAAAVLMSYLSDAQEVMAQGKVEHARTMLNCAKFIISEYLTPERV